MLQTVCALMLYTPEIFIEVGSRQQPVFAFPIRALPSTHPWNLVVRKESDFADKPDLDTTPTEAPC